MKNFRIFLAINLSKEIKSQLSSYSQKWPDLPVRWVKEDNLHLTLIFLGYVPDEELMSISKITRETAAKHSPFVIELKKILYGPPKKMPPRLIWVEGAKSKELSNLKKDFEESLIGGGVRFLVEDREFTPHITLGRIKTWQWRQIEPEERPEVNEEINLSFEVSSVEIMESQLKRAGPEYAILESCPLAEA